jgi:hypothetical protein
VRVSAWMLLVRLASGHSLWEIRRPLLSPAISLPPQTTPAVLPSPLISFLVAFSLRVPPGDYPWSVGLYVFPSLGARSPSAAICLRPPPRPSKTVTIEDIVTENQCDSLRTDEIAGQASPRRDLELLTRTGCRARIHHPLEQWLILGCRDDAFCHGMVRGRRLQNPRTQGKLVGVTAAMCGTLRSMSASAAPSSGSMLRSI